MDALEKTIVRARLIASGIIRYWHCEKSKEVHRWLEILAEELASLKEQGATLKIREELQRYGLRVPEVRIPVHPTAAISAQEQRNPGTSQTGGVSRTFINFDPGEEDAPAVQLPFVSSSESEQNTVDGTADSLSTMVTKANTQRVGQPQAKQPTGSWTWRGWNYNRVPPAIEEAVYDRFKQGWSKCKLAREFRLNRQTIIRICRRYES